MAQGTPHRDESHRPAPDPADAEARSAALELAGRLTARGVHLTGRESPAEIADMLDAIERFESVVQTHGGDLMVDDLRSSRPDDPHFVPPQRQSGEGVADYIARVAEATDRVRHHPRHPDA